MSQSPIISSIPVSPPTVLHSLVFEDHYELILKTIRRRKRRWYNKVPWFDFDDVEMVIIEHFHKKWHLYNPKYPLINWINTIISNRFRNILRDYTRHNLHSQENELATEIKMKNLTRENIDFTMTMENVKKIAALALTPTEYKVFDLFFIQNQTENDVARSLGYKISGTSSKGYNKNLKNLKESIILKMKEQIRSGAIEIIIN